MFSSFSYADGFFQLLVVVGMAVIPYVIYYFIIKAAVGNSKITTEVYALRRDLNELEHRQAERFDMLDTHLQEQNELLREQNELMRRRAN